MKNPGSNAPKATPSVPRRTFLATAATATAGFTIVPRHVLGGAGNTAPSDKLNIAGVGIGGMGKNNIERCSEENIVALCDVDYTKSAEVFEKYPDARRYKDFRVMFDKEKDIDAVIIATPDHSHAVIAMAAMERKKHIYVQKPLTHSVSEARLLTEAARKYGVVTQMGNQGHSGEGARILYEWVQDGAIGPIREAHAWTNRPVWPSGVEVGRPTETPAVPEGLDWDLWLGPAAARPYNPAYHPAKWRAWWDFGTGSLGDMGCHIVDPLFWALRLKYPTSVEANTSTFWPAFFEKAEPTHEMFPRSTVVRFRFPARENMPEVAVTWWDGGLMPPRPADLEPGRRMGDFDGGILLVGDHGAILGNCYGESPRIVPEKAMRRYRTPRPTVDRIPGGPDGHEKDWIRAIKDGGTTPASSNFEYSGPLSETVLMGNLAVRFPGKKLLWDGEAMAVTNDEDANAYVHRQYRDGWSL